MKLKFYRKSGNTFTVRSVKDFSIKSRGDCVSSVELIVYPWRVWFGMARPVMPALALNQIEAIVVTKGAFLALF